MIKVDRIMPQSLSLSENLKERPRVQEEGSRGEDLVRISEEGKRRHILGQLMANIGVSPKKA